MSPLASTVLLAIATCLGHAPAIAAPHPAAPPGLANPGFEVGRPGELPTSWDRMPTAPASYQVLVDASDPADGEQCIVVRPNPDAAEPAPWGAFQQTLDAAEYRGQRVSLSGLIRADTTGAADGAGSGLWIRIQRADGSLAFVGNMDGRLIDQDQWTPARIVSDIPADATQVAIGGLTLGSSTGAFDSLELLVLGATPASRPAAPLADRAVENLTALARVYGVVRYFHPSTEAFAADFDALACHGIDAVENAGSPAQLAEALGKLFAPIAPTVQVFPTGQAPPLPPEIAARPDRTRGTISWEHHGLGNNRGEPSAYQSRRAFDRRAETDTTPLRLWEHDLPGGVSCRIPLELYSTLTTTLPRGDPSALASAETLPMDGNDRTTRLAAVIVAWNVFQHFNPYMAMSGCDWEAALAAALREAAEAPTAREGLDALRRMTALSGDGHVMVTHPSNTEDAAPPLGWTWVGDQLIATAVGGLPPGERILAIDGVAIADLVRAKEALIAGSTPGWRRWRLLGELARGPAGSTIRLEVESIAGTVRLVTLPRASSTTEWRRRPPSTLNPVHLDQIDTGIWYIDINRLTAADLAASLPRLAAAKGVIIDFRGYPGVLGDPFAFFAALLDRPGQSAEWQIPIFKNPDQEDAQLPSVGHWELTAGDVRLPENRVFIIDGRAISFAESCMGIVEAFGLGQIVGAPTAGTNGNVTSATLPGGYAVMFTGMLVNKHDGTPLYGVGILPTIAVEPTRQGLAEGRDELLEAALEAARAAIPTP